MSSSLKRRPWPRNVADDPVDTVDANYASEFVSEKSPEFDAVRRAAADARQQWPGAVRSPDAATVPARTGTGRPARLAVYVAATAVLVAVGGFLLARQVGAPASTAAGPVVHEGTATIVSRPEGAEVFIDGARRGLAPLRLTLPVGTYALELRNGAATRALTLSIDEATAVREVIDLAPIATTGRIEVTSDTPGSTVTIDGVPRGVTPLAIPDITPGVHRVAISRGGSTVYRTVTVEAGATASVVVSAAAAAATSDGWLTFDAPIEMQVMENGRLLGTTGANRLMVSAGRHELQLVAASYGFQTTATIDVGAGRTVAVAVSVPNGRLSINAVPWADVWLDGQALGSTPLANLAVPVGDHTVVLRHPELGERRQTVRVGAGPPVRVGVDLNR